MYKYNEEFYDYIGGGAVDSAKIIVPLVVKVLSHPCYKVLDVGCGAGAWLSVWKQQGHKVTGLDGAYVNRDMLMVASDEFIEQDLSNGFSLGRRFDIAQCLEVAEHLPHLAANKLIKSLCSHSDVILFSAAAPGQGGENHINEKSYSYWRDLFEENNFQMYDCVRPLLVHQSEVMPWYRYNTFIYLNKACDYKTHELLKNSAVDSQSIPPDISPMIYRIRKLIIRTLPVSWQTQLAIIKKKINNFFNQK